MKKIIAFFALLAITAMARAQENGIRFEPASISWKTIQAIAKAKKKYIFLDCYATWCGPCKEMSTQVFPLQEVGKVFNDNYINVAVQMDQTAKDSKEIKAWYTDAKSINEQYAIAEYPTYLFFSPEGKLVHRIVGTASAPDLITQATNTLNPQKQDAYILNSWKTHLKDSVYLLSALKIASLLSNKEQTREVSVYYAKSLQSPITRDNVIFISNNELITSSKDYWFQLFLINAELINKLINKGYAQSVLGQTIFSEEVMPEIAKEAPVSWAGLTNKLKSKYPTLGDRLVYAEENCLKDFIIKTIRMQVNRKFVPADIWDKLAGNFKYQFPDYDWNRYYLEEKTGFFFKKQNWQESAQAAFLLMRDYGGQLNRTSLNNIIWFNVFGHCTDHKILLEALKWEKYLVESTRESADFLLDTYANLLYKTGNKQDALLWETRAIKLAELNNSAKGLQNLADYRSNLEKIKRNEKTWYDDTPTPK